MLTKKFAAEGEERTEQAMQTVPRKQKRKICILVIFIIALLAAFAAAAPAVKRRQWQKQIEIGFACLQEKDYENAAIALHKAAKILPSEQKTYVLFAMGEAAQGRFDEAENYLKAISERSLQGCISLDDGAAPGRNGLSAFATAEYENEECREITIQLYDSGSRKQYEWVYPAAGDAYIRSESAYSENGELSSCKQYDSSGMLSSESVYDENGKLKAERYYDEAAALLSRYEYAYDERGALLQATCYNADDTIAWYYSCTYDEYGNELSAIRCDADGTAFEETAFFDIVKGKNWMQSRNEYTYDDQGRMRSRTWLVDVARRKYVYDEKGKLIEETYADTGEAYGDAALAYCIEYVYDGQDNLILEKQTSDAPWLGSEEKRVSYWEYTYDASGNKLKGVHYNPEGTMDWCEEHVYGTSGNLLTETVYVDGEMESYREYIHDGSGGKLVCSLSQKSGGSDCTVHYFYLPEESLR